MSSGCAWHGRRNLVWPWYIMYQPLSPGIGFYARVPGLAGAERQESNFSPNRLFLPRDPHRVLLIYIDHGKCLGIWTELVGSAQSSSHKFKIKVNEHNKMRKKNYFPLQYWKQMVHMWESDVCITGLTDMLFYSLLIWARSTARVSFHSNLFNCHPEMWCQLII